MKRVRMLVVLIVLLAPAGARADAVLDWNAIATSLPVANPFVQARMLAMVQLAVFEAVNAVTGEYQPYLGTVVAPAGASADAAAVAAAHGVLKSFNPSDTTLDTLRDASLAAIPDGPAKDAGSALGQAAAAAILHARAADGSSPSQTYTPAPATPGVWQLTPACTAGVLFHFKDITPFGIPSAADFMPEPPPALTSTRYTKDYDEVMTVGRADSTVRPQDRTDVARFYAAASSGYLWSSVARQIATAQGRTLSENARALALIMMGNNDSLIASMRAKYHYDFWRPYTAIRAGDTDGNDNTDLDLAYTPLISTPCFPSYPSNHAAGSNGSSEVLRRLYGAGEHDITLTHPNVQGIVLHYAKLKDITQDIDDARVYGGIHFRFDQVAGGQLGRTVATYVFKNNLQPIDRE
jgi:hypothetical protein